MDRLNIAQKLTDFIKKYRYAVIVLAVGLLLMVVPMSKGGAAPAPERTQPAEVKTDLSEQLQEILGNIRGAGEVRVLLTVARGERVIYQTNEDRHSDGSVQQETVIVTDSDRNQFGLVQQTESPVYLGAVVVCQGADQPAVRLAIVEAVRNATGLGADKISVLNMK